MLENNEEKLRMQLVACGVAALSNTRKTAKERLTKDSPYWTVFYGDVCDAVDREMRLREAFESIYFFSDGESLEDAINKVLEDHSHELPELPTEKKDA